MCRNNELRKLRTMTGPARRDAVRRYLTESAQIAFGVDPHTLAQSQQCALSEVARAVCWRKSISSPMSLGLAFYVYLSRGVSPATN